MSIASSVVPPAPEIALYARFFRRLKAIFIDWVLALALVFGALVIASSLRSDAAARVLGVAVVLVLILYEPVLVSRLGGTLGHRWANLRVVDNGHGGNVSFAKACARVVIKGLLGWYSFIIMTATRRNQAAHDLLTGSTVQIRDAVRASNSDYITERTELLSAEMPSRLRRAIMIALYLVVLVTIWFAALIVLSGVGLLSERCLDTDACAPAEKVAIYGSTAVWLIASAVCIVLGWRASLFGARRTSESPARI